MKRDCLNQQEQLLMEYLSKRFSVNEIALFIRPFWVNYLHYLTNISSSSIKIIIQENNEEILFCVTLRMN